MNRRFLTAIHLLFWTLVAVAAEPSPAVRELLRFEQTLNLRKVDQSKIIPLDNFQDPKYAPEQALTFSIKSYWVDAELFHEAAAEKIPAEFLKTFYRIHRGKPQLRFLVHPESETLFAGLLKGAEQAEPFFATSTASSRTCLVWNLDPKLPAFFAKLSLDKSIGGVVRTIPKGEVARSIGTTRILNTAKGTLPPGFEYFEEIIGFAPKSMPRGGMIIRTIPAGIETGARKFIPLFSLYAQKSGGGMLLTDMAAKAPEGTALQSFVVERIFRPFLRQWLVLAIDHGISMEPHAQNVLIGIGSDGLPNGYFLHRDFGGFNVDLEYRRMRHLAMPADLPHFEDLAADYHQKLHAESLNQSLHNFFLGSFVYNLEQLPTGNAAHLTQDFMRVFSEEAQSLYSKNVSFQRILAPAVFNLRDEIKQSIFRTCIDKLHRLIRPEKPF